jgi:vancomycin resistance protein YoaR
MYMSRKQFLLPALFLISLSLILAARPAGVSAKENQNICKGVYIDQVDVSSMTREQAEAAVGELLKTLQAKGLAITVGENVVYSTLGDVGYTADIGSAVGEALNVGETGNLIKRYKELKDVEQGSLVISLAITYDVSKIKDIVTNDVSAFNIAPVNASVSIKSGKLVYTDHVVGSKVDIDGTVKVIEDTINTWNRQDIIVNAVVEEDMPQYTRDIVEQCNTVLGTYTTEYATSAWGRAENLANGARLINNAVLYPGDTFSAYEYLSPFTKANGYEVAGAYLQGKVIDSVGGGACQVTTTLYNAVLLSELEVVERQNHSMTISYVDLARDAAIAGTSKDFKFKNDTNAPILIEASTKNRTITFTIWGHEKRDTENRQIKFESEIISKTNPPADIVTKDPTKPTSYSKVTTAAHIGYRAKLWKIVYENGVQVDKILINTSSYQAAARCVTVGTKTVEEDTEEDTNNSKDSDKSGSGGKSSDEDQNLANPDDQLQGDIWDPLA